MAHADGRLDVRVVAVEHARSSSVHLGHLVGADAARLCGAAASTGLELSKVLNWRLAHARTQIAAFEDGLDQLVERVSACFPGGGVAVYRWDPWSELLVPTATNAIAEKDGRESRPLGTGAAGLALARGAPTLIADYQATVGSETPAGRAAVNSAISVPLRRDNDLIGAVSVGSDDPQLPFLQSDLEALSLLVNTGARLAALETLYQRHCEEAVRLAHHLLRDREAAEDVVQEAFLSVWRSGATHDAMRGTERTWVLAMVRHRATDYWRAALRRPTRSLEEHSDQLPHHDDPTAEVAGKLDGQDVLLALEKLPPPQRLVLELAYFGGLSHTEVAAQLGLPVGTVKGRIRLALDRLRVTLPGRDIRDV